MKTLTMKIPDDLASWINAQSRRTKRSRSAVIREILERQQKHPGQTALDLAGDLCGVVDSGLGSLSHSKKYLRDFGR